MIYFQEGIGRKSWPDSNFECSLMGAHLIYIDNDMENQYAHDVAYHRGSNLWIGLTEKVIYI